MKGEMIITLNNGEVKKLQGDYDGLVLAKVLCISKYHYLPLKEGDISLKDIDSIEVKEKGD